MHRLTGVFVVHRPKYSSHKSLPAEAKEMSEEIDIKQSLKHL